MHSSMGKTLVAAGLILAAVGALVMYSDKLPFKLGRLPGDIAIEKGNSGFYFPIATSILVSVVLSLVMWLIGRAGKR